MGWRVVCAGEGEIDVGKSLCVGRFDIWGCGMRCGRWNVQAFDCERCGGGHNVGDIGEVGVVGEGCMCCEEGVIWLCCGTVC